MVNQAVFISSVFYVYQCAAEGSSLSLLTKSLGQSLVGIYFLREEREHTRQRRVREVPVAVCVCCVDLNVLFFCGSSASSAKLNLVRFVQGVHGIKSVKD